MVTIVSCVCGKVEIVLSSSEPRVTTQCCCNHCFDRIRYLEEKRQGQQKEGNRDDLQFVLDLSKSNRDQDRPLTCSKWDNLFLILKGGRDEMFAYRLKPSSQVLNVASKCCHTFLLGRHAFYDRHCVTTCNECPQFFHSSKYNNNGLEVFPKSSFLPISRWFANQWDEDKVLQLDPQDIPAIWVNEGVEGAGASLLTGDEGYEKVLKHHLLQTERPVDVEHATQVLLFTQQLYQNNRQAQSSDGRDEASQQEQGNDSDEASQQQVLTFDDLIQAVIGKDNIVTVSSE